ncbi:hypothetical protein CAEBREN_11028 [Caenorhabditis brenneri]|uniref:Uncharacterized protein n=1 Tax=Caenorhabditis brenneri TaxID=135651 RepID=G0MTD2_CAEBE|nr:hypothetical protein CAEBREN_11028 [Caenorhabditis brenneri]
MALARVLIISNPMSSTFEKLSKPIFAIVTLIIFTLYSSMTPMYFVLPVTIVEVGKWTPDESCGFPANYSVPRYASGEPAYDYNLNVLLVFGFIDSINKFVTSLGLIVVTLVLVAVINPPSTGPSPSESNASLFTRTRHT